VEFLQLSMKIVDIHNLPYSILSGEAFMRI